MCRTVFNQSTTSVNNVLISSVAVPDFTSHVPASAVIGNTEFKKLGVTLCLGL